MYQKVRLELDGISVFKFVSRFQPIPASLSKKTGWEVNIEKGISPQLNDDTDIDSGASADAGGWY